MDELEGAGEALLYIAQLCNGELDEFEWIAEEVEEVAAEHAVFLEGFVLR